MSDRPNFLFISTDQQYAGAMRCTGNEDLSTPAMDSMAENGVRFERAYCTHPLCSPARASLSPIRRGSPRTTRRSLGSCENRNWATGF